MPTIKAIRIDKTDQGTKSALVDFDEADLMEGDVTVRVTHSTVNYKDGLALTGRAPIVRKFPMIGGIDLSGTVETSNHPQFQPGDVVVLNGFGLSETHFGGYAEKARVKGDWLVPLPSNVSPAQAMAIGTAGYTAMLSLLALEHHGLTPDNGPAVVTGAAGGVGSIAIALLAKAGWQCDRVDGPDGRGGLSEIAWRCRDHPAQGAVRARQAARSRGFAAGIDCVGSHTLVNVLAQTKYEGAVAACGLVQGMDLPGSVALFILRGVALLGINSVTCPLLRRLEAWSRLARDLDMGVLATMTTTISLAEVISVAPKILDGAIRGRLVVEIG